MIRRRVLVVVSALVLAGCSSGGSAPAPSPPTVAAGTVLLAKAEGWRPVFTNPGIDPYVLVEIAYDVASARQAWADNAPGATATADPYAVGLHGRFEDVDLATQRIVVVSAGESGSCAGWIRGLTLRGGAVDVLSGANSTPPDNACTADYRPYRMVLAVDADRLPTRAALGDRGAKGLLNGQKDLGGGVLVVPYPYPTPPP